MTMGKAAFAALVSVSLVAGGCANQTPEQRRQTGAIVGAVIGGAIGSQIGGDASAQIAAGVAGAVIGGLIGSAIAEQLNEEERRSFEEEQRRVLAAQPSATTQGSWRNADGNKSATIRAEPERPLKVALADSRVQNVSQAGQSLPPGTTCRSVGNDLTVPGQRIREEGLYCRDAKGDYVRVADVAAA